MTAQQAAEQYSPSKENGVFILNKRIGIEQKAFIAGVHWAQEQTRDEAIRFHEWMVTKYYKTGAFSKYYLPLANHHADPCTLSELYELFKNTPQ